jgi:hypothetical protein
MKLCGVDSSKISDEFAKNVIDNMFTFVNYFEINGTDTIIYMKKLWHDNFSDRYLCILGFQLIIQLYYDILGYKLRGSLCFYCDYEDIVLKIANMLSIDVVVKRLQIYIKFLELIKYNLNLNLLMDNLVIELGEIV